MDKAESLCSVSDSQINKDNEPNRTLLDTQAEMMGMYGIEKVEWKLKVLAETPSDEARVEQLLSERHNCKYILKNYDVNSRCVFNNEKGY